MAEGYVGKYGDALRRLQALEAAQQGMPVGPMGPQPVTGAFQLQGVPSNLNPAFAPQPSMPAFQQAGSQAPQGVLAGGQQPEADKAPQSAGEIISGLPANERKELRQSIEKGSGRSVDELYDQMVRSGEIAPPAEKKPKAKERLTAVAEAMFRYMSYAGRGMNPAAASAQATLETQGRRGALEQADIAEQNAEAAARRSEVQGVLTARRSRDQALADKGSERAWDASKEDVEHLNELELQKLRNQGSLAAASANEPPRSPDRQIGVDGTVFERNPETGVWEPARTIEEVEVSGIRGRKFKDKRPGVLKAGVKPVSGQVTEATLQRRVDTEVAAIRKDPMEMARIQKEVGNDAGQIAREVARRARARAEASLIEGAGSEYGDNPLD